MSNHKTPLTKLEKDGLIAHGLGRYIGKPSQLADVFRQGVAWALAHPPAPTQQPVKIGPLARRRVFDYIRGAYDFGYNDARNAKAVPGDGAPEYKGRDVEADYGGALLHALEAQGAQTTQQPSGEVFKQFIEWAIAAGYDVANTYDTDRNRWLCLNPMTADLWKAWQAAHRITASTIPAPQLEATQQATEPVAGQTRPLGYLPKWSVDRLTGDMGKVADPLVWGLYTHVYLSSVDHSVAIYTSPQSAATQPLTDEQIKALASALEAKGDTLRQFARAVEAAHGITSKEGGAA